MTDDIYSLPKTRAAAKEVGSKYYYTGKPCKYGHSTKRLTISRGCCECRRLWSIQNKKSLAEYNSGWNKNNRKLRSTYSKKWSQNNKQKSVQYTRLYQAQRLEAQPVWADQAQLNLIYQKRDELNKKWGTRFEVDHIVPLRNKNVCGLHCPENLQLLDKSLNAQKGNNQQ